MLNSSLFGLFLVTSFANIMTPGLGFVLVMGVSLQAGFARSIPVIIGQIIGIAILHALALSGLGLIISKTPSLYFFIKIAGALFLFYLGIKNFYKKPVGKSHFESVQKHKKGDNYFFKSILVALANPQPLIFVISVFPQFIDAKIPYVPQVLAMMASYAVMVFAGGAFYSLMANHARRFFTTENGGVLINRFVGCVFCSIGALVLFFALRTVL